MIDRQRKYCNGNEDNDRCVDNGTNNNENEHNRNDSNDNDNSIANNSCNDNNVITVSYSICQ